MENFKNYKIEKESLLIKIKKDQRDLQELSSIGIDCSDELEKLKNAVLTVEQDVINIVLLGSISDGKTSLIAGWLGEEQSDMKIDSDESSDEILVYKSDNLPDYCKLVDTPGLFGDKEDTVNNEKLSEKTKKIIDQATLIIYVVEAENPVKDSHKELLRWVLKDLNKLDNTIFVINKMDDVSDLTDDNDFNNMSLIKKNTLKNKLKEIADISSANLEKIHIICLSTDPQQKGFEFWKENRGEYEKRSRIYNLENEISSILKNNTTSALVIKTGYDVISRVITEKIKQVQESIRFIDEIIPEQEESLSREKKDFEHAKDRILDSRVKFQKELRAAQKKLINELSKRTIENINDFVEFSVGIKNEELGFLVYEQINFIANEYFKHAKKLVTNLCQKFEYEGKKQDKLFDKVVDKYGQNAADALKGAGKIPVDQIRNAVFAVRDTINKILGTEIKFKPYQALKIAEGVGKGLGIAGAAVDIFTEIYEAFKRNKENIELDKLKKTVKKTIEDIYNDVLDKTKDEDTFLKWVAPQLDKLETVLNDEEKAIENQKQQKKEFEKWKKNAVDADFTIN